MTMWKLIVGLVASATLFVLGAAWSQQDRGMSRELTAADYIEIEQLMNRYAHAIDTCSNNGYDYADLFTENGVFVDFFTDEGFAQNGLVRAVGREALARISGGADRGCENVGWKDWSHLMINPVIRPTPEGASGRR